MKLVQHKQEKFTWKGVTFKKGVPVDVTDQLNDHDVRHLKAWGFVEVNGAKPAPPKPAPAGAGDKK